MTARSDTCPACGKPVEATPREFADYFSETVEFDINRLMSALRAGGTLRYTERKSLLRTLDELREMVRKDEAA